MLRQSVTNQKNNFNQKTTYSYDAVSRLRGAETTNGAGAVIEDFAYVYDDNGNLTRETVDGAVTNFVYNDGNELASMTDASGTTTFSYDGAGNLVSSSKGLTIDYNTRNQTSRVQAGGQDLAMKYQDADSNRRVTAGTKRFGYSQVGLGVEINDDPGEDPKTFYARDDSGTLAQMRRPAGDFYYLLDGLGSVVGRHRLLGRARQYLQIRPVREPHLQQRGGQEPVAVRLRVHEPIRVHEVRDSVLRPGCGSVDAARPGARTA